MGSDGVPYDVAKFGVLHDAAYDQLGLRLATASADGVVRVWSTESREVLKELRAHKAPVWSVSWALGRHGHTALLASVSADGHVVIWREARPGEWQIAYQLEARGPAPVVAFCPPEYGVVLAMASSTGEVRTLVRREVTASPVLPAGEQWQGRSFMAHPGGSVVALSWSPSASPAILATGPAAQKAAPHAPQRMVTAGTDRRIRIWHCDERGGNPNPWTQLCELADERCQGNIRDVAWRPNLGIPSNIIASCTEEGQVVTWVQDMDGQPWRLQAVWEVGADARRLTWSKAGMLLGISIGDNGSTLYKEGPMGVWKEISMAEG